MKLLDSLYTVVSDRIIDDGRQYDLRLNPEHFIYKAHFPGEPITPGVCIMQMAQELAGLATGEKLSVECVRNVKFLHIITPDSIPQISCSLQKMSQEDGMLRFQTVFTSGDEVSAKLSLICRIVRT